MKLIEKTFIQSGRHAFDFSGLLGKYGWHQFDTGQDASWYGNWVNPHTLQIVSYVEGDIYLVTCENGETFFEEITEMKNFQKELGYRFYIDPPLPSSKEWPEFKPQWKLTLEMVETIFLAETSILDYLAEKL